MRFDEVAVSKTCSSAKTVFKKCDFNIISFNVSHVSPSYEYVNIPRPGFDRMIGDGAI